MTEYAAYFDSEFEKWKVIKKDEDGYWFNYALDAGTEENAKEIAGLMNERQRKW